jgi:hypothetical protein
MSEAESYCKENNLRFKVYAIFNCGFFEGKQCKSAFPILEYWCKKAGLVYSGGVGIGGGEMLGALPIILYLAVLIPLIQMMAGLFYIPAETLSFSTVAAGFNWRITMDNILILSGLEFWDAACTF